MDIHFDQFVGIMHSVYEENEVIINVKYNGIAYRWLITSLNTLSIWWKNCKYDKCEFD